MTRIARMNLLCEGCERAGGNWYCVECRIPLCEPCVKERCAHGCGDATKVQTAHFVNALTFCDVCDSRPAAVSDLPPSMSKDDISFPVFCALMLICQFVSQVYCETEGSVLCMKCDRFLHSGKVMRKHVRKSITVTITERSASLVPFASDSDSESVHDGSVVEPPTSPPSSPVVEPLPDELFTLEEPPRSELDAHQREEVTLKKFKAGVKKREKMADENGSGSGSGGNNNGSDARLDPASSKGASGDAVTNNGSNDVSNGSNGDEGTSSIERASMDASADLRTTNGKGGGRDRASSRDSCSSGAVSGNGGNTNGSPEKKQKKTP
uniref:B box-type domain-containing protein n=1 Tax=Rhodosorus marinus TaxID=101924 RepID=A0A7S2ZVI3_9RHOD|mmetsp:Transcript_34290/g.134479  ORF Transcript_34290/g.134479 Transcript_34290/m.134479 type:complete len:324 (+) Transcript_34290:114-1085(+)